MKVKTNKLLQLEYKRFFTNKLWICIAIFLLVNSIIWGYKYKEREEDIIYNEMVEEYRGKATAEKIQQIIDAKDKTTSKIEIMEEQELDTKTQNIMKVLESEVTNFPQLERISLGIPQK